MKTLLTITILILTTLCSFAETVYLNGVGVTNTAHTSLSEPPLVVDHLETVSLWDARGINLVTVQPFLNVFQDGELLPRPDVPIVIWSEGRYGWEYWWTGEPLELPVIAFEFDVLGPDDIAYTQTVGAQFRADEGWNWAYHYLENNPPSSPQNWSYGFDVISYTTVPEPSTWLLLVVGLCVLIAYRRKAKPSSA